MNFGILVPIVAIVASAWVAVALIKFWSRESGGGKATPAEATENRQLAEENVRLRATVARLEERMSVLETIATDPGQRTAREIERLR